MKTRPTQRQQELLNFITQQTTRVGYPPTIREMARHLRIKGISAIKKHLDALQKKGCLTRTSGARAIEIPGRPQSVSVPVLGQVAAGKPILAEENILGTLALDRSIVHGAQSFLLKVKGDSMIGAGILSGDFVLVKAQPKAENGEIVVALIEDEATVKRLYYRPHQVILKSENPDYPSLILTQRDNPRIIGKVIGVIRFPVFT